METKDVENVIYCWAELNKLLTYLLSSRYTDDQKVQRAKSVAFDICIKFSKDFEKEVGRK